MGKYAILAHWPKDNHTGEIAMSDPYDSWKLASPDDEPYEQAKEDAEYDDLADRDYDYYEENE